MNKENGLITGISLILMALAAGYVYGYVHGTIYVLSDTELTSKLYQENLNLYKSGIAGWVLILVLDIIVSITIYLFYRTVNQNLAALTSVLRIVYTLFLCVAISNLVEPFISSNGIKNITTYFEGFEKFFSYGLILFGFHLLTLSILCFKSKFTPNLIAILLLLGGLSYIFVHSTNSFFQNSNLITPTLEIAIAVVMTVSELAFAIWIIVKSYRLK